MKKNNAIWILSAVVVVAIASLALYLSSQQKGYIKLDTPGAKMKLRSGFFSSVNITSAVELDKVNARVYRPQWLSITKKQNGDTWRMESFGPWGTMATVKVSEGQTTILKPGPPFLVKANVNPSSRRVSIGFRFQGQAGELYTISATKNGRR
ncbi:MAG: hypothetical protein ACYS9Y_14930, partial [Planctomycetota bacterium]